jgi:hypothetical protein
MNLGFRILKDASCNEAGDAINNIFFTDYNITLIINSTRFLKILRIQLFSDPNPPAKFSIDVYWNIFTFLFNS